MRLTHLLPALVVTVLACSDDYNYDPAPAPGELGAGVFLYRCPDLGDPHCSSGGLTADEFPQAFARGSRFELVYDWTDEDDRSKYSQPQLQSGAPALLTRDSDSFHAIATGFAAVLAVTGNSEVVDLVHLRIREVDNLHVVLADTPDAPIEQLPLTTGQTTTLQARMIDSDKRRLGGTLDFAWTSEDPDILAITGGTDSGTVRVAAGIAGTTNLQLQAPDFTVTVAITVEDTDDPDTDTGEPESSTGEPGTSTGEPDTDTDTGEPGTSTGEPDTDTGAPGTSTGESGTTGGAL